MRNRTVLLLVVCAVAAFAAVAVYHARSQATVERLLGFYTPRNLYALVTLLMRIEAEVDVTDWDFPHYEVVDETGTAHQAVMLDERTLQGLRKRRLTFLARDLPPEGYRTYWLREGSPPAPPMTAQRNTIENDRIRVVADPKSGFLSSMYDKANQREWVSPGQALARWNILEEGLFELDYGSEMKAWNFGFTGKTCVPDTDAAPAITQDSPQPPGAGAIRVLANLAGANYAVVVSNHLPSPRNHAEPVAAFPGAGSWSGPLASAPAPPVPCRLCGAGHR